MMTTATAQKCVHKGCGKVFTDPEEECEYHPGPPEFHEGQKGEFLFSFFSFPPGELVPWLKGRREGGGDAHKRRQAGNAASRGS